MKLAIKTQVSVDQVVQGNGGRHPGLDPGFGRGGRVRPPEYVASSTLTEARSADTTVCQGWRSA